MIDKDEAIVRNVLDGQTEAFAKLVDRHKERVFAVLMRLMADPDVAEELAHETFVRAYRGLPNFRGESSFGTWLVQIAIHLARDHVRQRQRNRFVSLDALLERDADDPQLADRRPHRDPLAEIGEKETMKRFHQALNELPANYREVFVLYHIEDMSYEDIAELTGDSVGSLKVRAHRARKLIKESLFPETKSVTARNVTD